MSAPNQPPVPWWARIPWLVAGAAALVLAGSIVMPWFTGPYDHARYGPVASIVVVLVSTLVSLVMMIKRTGWTWAPGVLTLSAAVMVLIGLEAQVVCPTDVEVEGNIAQACFTEEWTSGSTIFAVGSFASALVSFAAPRLTRFAEDYSWARRRSS